MSSIKSINKCDFFGLKLNCSSSKFYCSCLPPSKISLAMSWMSRTIVIITLLLKVTNSINSAREGRLLQHGQENCRCTSLLLHWQKLSRLLCAIMSATDGRYILCLPLSNENKQTNKEKVPSNKRTLCWELNDHCGRSTFTWALLFFHVTFIFRFTAICCRNWTLPLTDRRQIGCHAKWTFNLKCNFYQLDKCLHLGKICWLGCYCLYFIN